MALAPMTSSPSSFPDWKRLQQALAVEAERGFNNLKGNRHQFSEFLVLSFQQTPETFLATDQVRWKEVGDRFTTYNDLSYAQRQHLVAETRRLLYQLRKNYEVNPTKASSAKEAGASSSQGSGSRYPATESGQNKTSQNKASKNQASKNQANKTKKSKKPKTTALSPPQQNLGGPARDLEIPLTQLNGIGPKAGEKLAKLGIWTVRDLLFYYPRDHLDYAKQVNIRELEPGEMATLIATVKRCNCFSSPRNRKLTIFDLTVRDHSGQLKISRFYAGARFGSRGWQERQKRMYPPGAIIAASGMVKKGKYGVTLDNPEIEVLDSSEGRIESLKIGRVVPVYALTEGVGADLVRRAVIAALPSAPRLPDALPKGLKAKYDLLELPAAIAQIHFPEDNDQLQAARRRLVFDEFFYLQLGLLKRRAIQRQEQTSIVLAPTGELIDKFHEILPFEFTGAQKRVANAALTDMQQSVPMNRLIQGDVGSGKTVVAVVALLAAIQAGYQGALMAPTEVLAEQHYHKLVEWFNQLGLPVELLTGSTKTAKRREIHRQLRTGELPLLVGTHALIEDPVQFSKLGLVVIDEQHRFGVAQRARLQQKGDNPHVLTMTATPIPRTLALTLHGDLDVSQIDELPPGRQAIQTSVLNGNDRQQGYDLMRREIAQGRQVYVVLPLVEESEKLDLKSAVEEHHNLQETVFPEFKVGLLHGRMSSAEKEEAIQMFRDRHTQLLVSTTVVEVGVDIPNATVMLIEHAERFGLSQLHQLRGRVGRGGSQSYCLLMSSSQSETAQQRLKVMEQSQDGFFISEMDMRFRGPGEVLGKRQSGLPDFALASLVEDQDVLEIARSAAAKAIEKDETLDRWPQMKAELNYRYQRLMGGAILT